MIEEYIFTIWELFYQQIRLSKKYYKYFWHQNDDWNYTLPLEKKWHQKRPIITSKKHQLLERKLEFDSVTMSKEESDA